MTGLDLRPLSLGEVLDRTFTLYRRHFALFVGIAAIPHLATLAFGLVGVFVIHGPVQISADGRPVPLGLTTPMGLLFGLLSVVVGLMVYLFTQGGTIVAVSELYLGRTSSIGSALRRVWENIGSLFGTVVLNGLALLLAVLALIIPAFYVACRLLVCLPAALIEGKGPRESLTRSWHLTQGYALRAFVLYVFYFVIALGLGLLVGLPLGSFVLQARDNPEGLRLLQALSQVLTTLINVVIQPLFLIGTSVYYYDLRVRKEAFDLQFMMDPDSERITGGGDRANSIAP